MGVPAVEAAFDASATVVFALLCLVCMFFLVQGVAFFYAGLTPFNSALTQSANSIMALCIASLQFYVFGGSLISQSGDGWLGLFFGSLRDIFMIGMPSDIDGLGEYLTVALLRVGFSSVAGAIMIGATNQRGRLLPSLIFLFLWLTLVYDTMAYWCWNEHGWSYRIGALDYAGGTAVHLTAGISALVYSSMLGFRLELPAASQQPFSLLSVVAGTFLMWAGWIGFNGGAAIEPSVNVLHTLLNSQIAASAGGLTWMLLDHSFDEEWSIVGLCSGIISGLVCVTPGAAFIPTWASLIFGITGSLACNFGTKLKFQLAIDDGLDIFAVHGIGGFTGSILTGIFASPRWSPHAGLIYGRPFQVLIQIFSATAIIIYTSSVSYALLRMIDMVPGLQLRVSKDWEAVGLDLLEHGETAFSTADTSNASNFGVTFPRTEPSQNRYKQTHLNVSMFPEAGDSPLLQRASTNYGGTLSNNH